METLLPGLVGDAIATPARGWLQSTGVPDHAAPTRSTEKNGDSRAQIRIAREQVG